MGTPRGSNQTEITLATGQSLSPATHMPPQAQRDKKPGCCSLSSVIQLWQELGEGYTCELPGGLAARRGIIRPSPGVPQQPFPHGALEPPGHRKTALPSPKEKSIRRGSRGCGDHHLCRASEHCQEEGPHSTRLLHGQHWMWTYNRTRPGEPVHPPKAIQLVKVMLSFNC